MGIEIMKYGDRIPADPNANLDRLVGEHGADGVLIDGVSVAQIAERARIEAEANIEQAEVAELVAFAAAEDSVAAEAGAQESDAPDLAPE